MKTVFEPGGVFCCFKSVKDAAPWLATCVCEKGNERATAEVGGGGGVGKEQLGN